MQHSVSSAASEQVFLSQNGQLPAIPQATEPQDTVDHINTTGPTVDVRNPVSLEVSDNEMMGKERAGDFATCHGSTSTVTSNVNESSSTLVEIFRCFICLGKVCGSISCLSCCSGSGYALAGSTSQHHRFVFRFCFDSNHIKMNSKRESLDNLFINE